MHKAVTIFLIAIVVIAISTLACCIADRLYDAFFDCNDWDDDYDDWNDC